MLTPDKLLVLVLLLFAIVALLALFGFVIMRRMALQDDLLDQLTRQEPTLETLEADLDEHPTTA